MGEHVYDMIVIGAVPARELLADCPAGRGQEMAIVGHTSLAAAGRTLRREDADEPRGVQAGLEAPAPWRDGTVPRLDECTLAFGDERHSDDPGPHDRNHHSPGLAAGLRSGDETQLRGIVVLADNEQADASGRFDPI